MDSLSPLLQEKTRWLVKENQNEGLQKAIFEFLANLNHAAYRDLYILEELETTFRIDWTLNHEPDNPYLQEIRHHLTARETALGIDVKRLDTLRLIVHQLVDSTLRAQKMQPSQQEELLSAEIQTLIPGYQERNAFLSELAHKFGVPLQHLLSNQQPWKMRGNANQLVVNRSIRLIDLALSVAHSTSVFADGSSTGYVVSLSLHDSASLIQLCQIADTVVQEASSTVKKPLSTITLDMALGTGSLNLQPEEYVAFMDSLASKIGVKLSLMDYRTLSTLGRLSFWLWQAESEKRQQEQALEEKIEQVRVLTVDELRQRLSNFEATMLSQESQHDLSLEVQALCKLYTNSEPIRVVEALIPLIVWLNENDSQVLNQAFQTLYLGDRDSFWVISESLLEHEDQRIVDFASQVLEQAEYTEEQSAPGEVFDRLMGITVNQFGMDPFEIMSSGSFADDPNVDSLDFVDLVLPHNEKFEIQKRDAEKDTTVHQAADYLEERLP